MRALVITKNGAPEVLQVQERPDPVPGPGEVQIAVKAAGINFADVMARVGMYPDAPKPPSVIGYEVAGDVAAVGTGVTDFAVGDRVMAGTRFGGYAEVAVTSAGSVSPLPADWSYEEGAAFPVNYVTAYAAITRYGALRAGERVLINAAAGGVGIAATQLAKPIGAEIFGTASGSKHDAIRGFGVQHAIDYTTQDVAEEVARITGSKAPLDLVLDAVGGKSLRTSIKMLRPGGRVVAFGASSVMDGDKRNLRAGLKMLASTPWLNPMKMMGDSKGVIGLNILTIWDDRKSLDDYLEPLRAMVDDGTLRPVVAESFPLERGGDAQRYLAERRNVGKVVLTV